MTYRSEQGALAAELEHLEADLAETTESAQALAEELARRRRYRRRRRLTRLLAWAFVVSAAACGSAFIIQRRAHEQYRVQLAELERDLTWLEQRIDQLRRVRDIAEETPALAAIDELSMPNDGALFAAVRAADPQEPEDAWWILAHASCRLADSARENSVALAKLDGPRREKAREFCARGAKPR